MRAPKHGGNASCSNSCCLAVNGLSVSLGGKTIFEDVSFHLHCGELVALIGPNGAGKSTLIRCLINNTQYGDKIRFSPVNGKSTRPLIGYVPQSPALTQGSPVSVLDMFACGSSKRPAFLPQSRAFRQKVLERLQSVNGQSLIDKRIGELSGGELQRVLLAAALEPVPHILILDEPLSAVDVEGTASLMEMLDKIRNQFDLSILISTHDFSMLPLYADKALLLHKTLAATGSPEQVLKSPEFARAFGLPS